jgi:hypothetical protein
VATKPHSNESKTTRWPSLEKLPPSVVFLRTAAFMQDDDGEAEQLQSAQGLLELVEWSAEHANVREFVEPTEPLVKTTREQTQRALVSFSTMISLLEHGALEQALVTSPGLLGRFRMVRDTALTKLKAVRSVMVSALENEAGAARKESPEERLRRSIAIAKTEAPIDVGSFAAYADEPDEPSEER